MFNTLEQIYYCEPHRICQKWAHYFKVYERYLQEYRGRRMRFLEIGLSQGGSLQMWKRYLGPNAEIIGLDVDPLCRRFEDEQTRVFIGDQGDSTFMRSLAHEVGQVDVVLDDGGHRMNQQVVTFEALFPIVALGGVYICEDVHTSYDRGFGGGLRAPGSFIEYMKRKIDEMHGWYTQEAEPTTYLRWMKSVAFYDSMVVIEKDQVNPPIPVEVGY